MGETKVGVRPPRCPICNGIVRPDGSAYNWELTPEHPGRFNDAPWYGWRCEQCQRLFKTEVLWSGHKCGENRNDN